MITPNSSSRERLHSIKGTEGWLAKHVSHDVGPVSAIFMSLRHPKSAPPTQGPQQIQVVAHRPDRQTFSPPLFGHFLLFR
eukprot:m.458346 g.458346  ORF g.458346 m.458346 type:complete len:80 (+) comp21470_c0_seq1:130-369(+)